MSRVLWVLFYLLIAIVAITTFLFIFGIDLTKVGIYKAFILGLPVALLYLHSLYMLGYKRALFFVLLSMFVGWLAETIGLSYGRFFGGEYIYQDSALMIGSVPFDVVFYWSVFIYTSYSMVNGFLRWREIKLNTLRNLILAIVADGVVLTSIDLFMDPLQVREGAWTWIDGGPYFDIPTGNFIGWFVVGVITTGIFRTFLLKAKDNKEYQDNLLLIPLIGYGLLIMSFSLQAIDYQMYGVLKSGLTIMGSIFVVVIHSYLSRAKVVDSHSLS